ncbi:Putative Zn-dependent protease, contains TPR repeats [Sphingomonas guangdongensis]|uniref:Zn-dependent protease, contains TPR repeats n=1 Tax=Sphingomonas guangdongensis TaxID=1141890 RepID=A0A285QE91_9SPHN|nr:M48 family metalloprotease [Sphingomonas guangdongensis]SOB79838.1 Putative Zn-dependent protease, contains TPR repeats [Sphingomonas guangdongensis]
MAGGSVLGWVRHAATVVVASASLLAAPSASAQSILRDAETEALFADMSRDIIAAAGLAPANVRIVVINDPSINAFVAGGQIVYVHSGLIDAADNANEVQGVIAHELGHVANGHIPLQDQGYSGAMGLSIVSLVLGIAAIAAGSGEAGAGILAAGQRAALGKLLAFTRVQESSADAAGARYLNTAGITGRGMLSFFKKLQNMEYRYGISQSEGSFERTHPLTGERLAALDQVVRSAPTFSKAADTGIDARFKRVQAKLRGYVNEPRQTLVKYPMTDQSLPAHYARAYAYHLSGYPDQAAKEAAALVKAEPNDPYFLELQGQILLEGGDPGAALPPLREATAASRSSPLIATTFGHALLATEDAAHLGEAEKVLRLAVQRDNDNPWAWMQLGTVYERKGDQPRTALATAERASLMGDARTALFSARAAMAGLPQGSSDWIRAQDILLVSQTQMEKDRKERRR